MAEMMNLMQMDKLPPEYIVGADPYSSSSSVNLSTMDFSDVAPPQPTLVNATPSPPLYFPHAYGSVGPVHDPPENEDGNRNRNQNKIRSCTKGNTKERSIAAMREMIFRIAAMQPVQIDPESVKPRRRKNVRISKDPQSVAARHRRERISERIRILQRLVPGGTKMDTASMLDEAIHYVSFLKTQVQSMEWAAVNRPRLPPPPAAVGYPLGLSAEVGGESFFPVMKGYPIVMHTGGFEQH